MISKPFPVSLTLLILLASKVNFDHFNKSKYVLHFVKPIYNAKIYHKIIKSIKFIIIILLIDIIYLTKTIVVSKHNNLVLILIISKITLAFIA